MHACINEGINKMGQVFELGSVKSVNGNAIEMARDLLERCENGEVIDFAIVGMMPDGYVTTAWPEPVNTFKLIGAVDWLKHRLLLSLDESE